MLAEVMRKNILNNYKEVDAKTYGHIDSVSIL